jgi:predicted transcriptional regulator
VPNPKLTRLELQIMDALWTRGAQSVREIQEAFPEKNRPAYTTVQTMVYRLEGKKAIRRVKKIGNAHIFEAAVSRKAAQRGLIDELLSFFGGRSQPVMAHLIETGKLTLEDVQAAEQTLRKLAKKDKP